MTFLKKIVKKLGLLSTVKSALKSYNFSRSINIDKVKVNIPFVYGIQCKIDEPWMTEILKRVLKNTKGTFVDIGANIGQTLIQVKAIDANRKYVGFEPNPSCIFYLEILVKANNFADCVIVPAGLYRTDTIVTLDLFGEDITNTGGSIVKDFRAMRSNNKVFRKILVPVYTFETVSKEILIDEIAVLKIDVEGGELEVLESLQKSIDYYKPIIILEVLPVYNKSNSDRLERQQKLEKILFNLNYDIFRIVKEPAKRYKTILKLTDFGIHDNLNDCDYILLHKDQIDNVKSYL